MRLFTLPPWLIRSAISEDNSFFLCKYFIGWHLTYLHKDWGSSSPSSFFPTSFYSSCSNVLLHLNLDKVQLLLKVSMLISLVLSLRLQEYIAPGPLSLAPISLLLISGPGWETQQIIKWMIFFGWLPYAASKYVILSQIGVTFLMAHAPFVLVRKQLITVSSIARPRNENGRTSGLCLLRLRAMLCQFSNYFLFLVLTT